MPPPVGSPVASLRGPELTPGTTAALAAVCAPFVNCKWDNLATFNYQFAASDVSTIDYFHPSVTGQTHLAATTWAASFWPTA